MSKVTIRASKSEKPTKARSLTFEEFWALRALVLNDPCWSALVSVAAGLGLRISEVLGLKWKDVDWLNKTINIERGVVKQIVDDVKSTHSARTMAAADDILNVLQQWRSVTQFPALEDWIYASPYRLGRQPLCYTYVWETLRDLAKKAGIEHVSSHCFRHGYRSWLDAVGTPVGHQKLMRHARHPHHRNIYGDAATDDMRKANAKVAQIAFAQQSVQ